MGALDWEPYAQPLPRPKSRAPPASKLRPSKKHRSRYEQEELWVEQLELQLGTAAALQVDQELAQVPLTVDTWNLEAMDVVQTLTLKHRLEEQRPKSEMRTPRPVPRLQHDGTLLRQQRSRSSTPTLPLTNVLQHRDLVRELRRSVNSRAKSPPKKFSNLSDPAFVKRSYAAAEPHRLPGAVEKSILRRRHGPSFSRTGMSYDAFQPPPSRGSELDNYYKTAERRLMSRGLGAGLFNDRTASPLARSLGTPDVPTPPVRTLNDAAEFLGNDILTPRTRFMKFGTFSFSSDALQAAWRIQQWWRRYHRVVKAQRNRAVTEISRAFRGHSVYTVQRRSLLQARAAAALKLEVIALLKPYLMRWIDKRRRTKMLRQRAAVMIQSGWRLGLGYRMAKQARLALLVTRIQVRWRAYVLAKRRAHRRSRLSWMHHATQIQRCFRGAKARRQATLERLIRWRMALKIWLCYKRYRDRRFGPSACVIQRTLRRGIITGKAVRMQRIVRGFLGRVRFKKCKARLYWTEQTRRTTEMQVVHAAWHQALEEYMALVTRKAAYSKAVMASSGGLLEAASVKFHQLLAEYSVNPPFSKKLEAVNPLDTPYSQQQSSRRRRLTSKGPMLTQAPSSSVETRHVREGSVKHDDGRPQPPEEGIIFKDTDTAVSSRDATGHIDARRRKRRSKSRAHVLQEEGVGFVLLSPAASDDEGSVTSRTRTAGAIEPPAQTTPDRPPAAKRGGSKRRRRSSLSGIQVDADAVAFVVLTPTGSDTERTEVAPTMTTDMTSSTDCVPPHGDARTAGVVVVGLKTRWLPALAPGKSETVPGSATLKTFSSIMSGSLSRTTATLERLPTVLSGMRHGIPGTSIFSQGASKSPRSMEVLEKERGVHHQQLTHLVTALVGALLCMMDVGQKHAISAQALLCVLRVLGLRDDDQRKVLAKSFIRPGRQQLEGYYDLDETHQALSDVVNERVRPTVRESEVHTKNGHSDSISLHTPFFNLRTTDTAHQNVEPLKHITTTQLTEIAALRYMESNKVDIYEKALERFRSHHPPHVSCVMCLRSFCYPRELLQHKFPPSASVGTPPEPNQATTVLNSSCDVWCRRVPLYACPPAQPDGWTFDSRPVLPHGGWGVDTERAKQFVAAAVGPHLTQL